MLAIGQKKCISTFFVVNYLIFILLTSGVCLYEHIALSAYNEGCNHNRGAIWPGMEQTTNNNSSNDNGWDVDFEKEGTGTDGDL